MKIDVSQGGRRGEGLVRNYYGGEECGVCATCAFEKVKSSVAEAWALLRLKHLLYFA